MRFRMWENVIFEFKISDKGISPLEEKLTILKNIMKPRNSNELKSLLEMVGYYSIFF